MRMGPEWQKWQPKRLFCAVWALVFCTLHLLGATPAQADNAEAGHVVGLRHVSDTHSVLDVYSPSMGRVIANDILRPASGGTLPTLYLLSGALGNEDGVGWLNNSSIADFFADKNVTVAMPIGGRFGFYTDWQSADPVLGNYQWQTYLTRELPQAIDSQFGSTGRNAVAGLSMSGGPALDLAVQAPDVFDAAASLSGCPAPSNPLAVAGISTMIAAGLNNPFNMWGPPGSPGWYDHDPTVNVERLRGTSVYVSASAGRPGPVDRIPAGAAPPLGGIVVEALVNYCTSLFVDALHRSGVPATVSMREEGAHTWPLFEDQLREAWAKTIAPALSA
ncbi:alpha/beta hydrolase family protein [Rhodococcus sp. G-MC3]|uniref:alpha/beta hydrolase n=1 Tax=Rhodococcus sp. G-MC3 TaxID=3046209 RepID=UPI0024BA80DA|nr:alpha/beta hydrolase family protein [Rhodococcus sp. G-MC3]MDJ0393162.1 alpha/beta hydrolase family protein [Rhodococcus sp. G-MC3]